MIVFPVLWSAVYEVLKKEREGTVEGFFVPAVLFFGLIFFVSEVEFVFEERGSVGAGC